MDDYRDLFKGLGIDDINGEKIITKAEELLANKEVAPKFESLYSRIIDSWKNFI
ncbi:MAG: hypothetical protein WCV92_00735 [Candidatus Buchananbacteria bacterium]